MKKYREPDFGATHNKGHLVIDDEGTITVAYYANGAWWEGHPDPDDAPVQLNRVPVGLYDPQVSA